MALDLVWSPEAIEDIEAIASYIERDSPWYATAVVSRMVETIEAIPDFPESGRIVPEIGKPDIREKIVYTYRIIYRIGSERILIVAVIHGSRLMLPLLPRIEKLP